MTMGSLFSGVGGLELGLEWAGIARTVWQVEQDEGCRAVLARHWPNADRSITDVRSASTSTLQHVDLICGGFPCQDVSSAGKRVGLAGARSGLWYEYARIVEGIRPRWVVVENVASGKAKYLCEVRSDLRDAGYRTAAVALSAADVGAPHRRSRIFVVAHADGERRDRRCMHVTAPRYGEVPNYAPCRCRDRSLADSDSDGRKGRASRGAISECEPRRDVARRGEVADPERVELRDEQGRSCGAHGAGTSEPRNDGAPVGRGAEPRLGRSPDGIPDRVDRWPSRRDEPQAAWEPPRVVEHIRGSNRRPRLKALGNAVVPQCSEVIGRMIAAVESGRYPWEFVFEVAA